MQQKILSLYPSQPLKVYVVWQPIHRPDTLEAAERAARQLFKDDRVMHFWDGDNEIGRWYGQEDSLEINGTVMWDACYLYSADAGWDDEPEHLLSAGHPVVDTHEALLKALQSEWSRIESR